MARILLVDDEVAVRHSLGAFLRGCGHEVREASNGLEAIAALRVAAPDVVITDINMPDMDGIEIVTSLREATSGVGIIAMSGGGLFGKEMLLDSAAALGADFTMEKPIDLAELRRAIDVLAREREGA